MRFLQSALEMLPLGMESLSLRKHGLWQLVLLQLALLSVQRTNQDLSDLFDHYLCLVPDIRHIRHHHDHNRSKDLVANNSGQVAIRPAGGSDLIAPNRLLHAKSASYELGSR